MGLYNRRMRRFACSLGLLLATIAPAGGANAVSDRTSRVLPIAAGTPIRIDATIADVVISGSARSDLRVDVERRVAARDDLARLPVTIDTGSDGVHVAVVQERDGRNADLKATITIAAPADADVRSVRVFEGSVKLTNLTRACDV